jgi:hypothetical protein
LLYVVAPSQPGTRTLDHAVYMSQIEQQLRQQRKDHVLLVPVLED